MNIKSIIKPLTIIILCLCIKPSAWGQVDDTQPTSDTLYIYDEEVIYDTLYIQNAPLEELLTKEDLLEAFQKKGVGQIYYKKGHFWITGNNEVYKLNNPDLQTLFTPAQYELYRKAKRNQYISIPLFALGGGAAIVAGLGLVQFGSCLVMMAQAGSHWDFDENLMVKAWKGAMGGFFFLGGGLIVATGCFVPSIILTIKSNVNLKRIAEEFNQPKTSMKLSFGPTPMGAGLTLSF
jgi:hypothetical protein